MRHLLSVLLVLSSLVLTGCVSDGKDNILTSAASAPSQTSVQNQPTQINSIPQRQLSYENPNSSQVPQQGTGVFASEQQTIQPFIQPRNKKTHLINGLASSVESIGYGFTNLSKKIPGAKLHNYASFVESSTIIRSQITRDLKSAYRRDPNVEINLIGISFGANIVTLIAADLDRAGIPIHYLATMEGPAMVPIGKNVKVADNFSCTNIDCFRTKSRLGWGNKKTRYSSFKIKSSHIPLANHADVHRRIISQINRPRPPLVATQ